MEVYLESAFILLVIGKALFLFKFNLVGISDYYYTLIRINWNKLLQLYVLRMN